MKQYYLITILILILTSCGGELVEVRQIESAKTMGGTYRHVLEHTESKERFTQCEFSVLGTNGAIYKVRRVWY